MLVRSAHLSACWKTNSDPARLAAQVYAAQVAEARAIQLYNMMVMGTHLAPAPPVSLENMAFQTYVPLPSTEDCILLAERCARELRAIRCVRPCTVTDGKAESIECVAIPVIRPNEGRVAAVLVALGPSHPLGVFLRKPVGALRALCALAGHAYELCEAHADQAAVGLAAVGVSGHNQTPEKTAARALFYACELLNVVSGDVWLQDEGGWYKLSREQLARSLSSFGLPMALPEPIPEGAFSALHYFDSRREGSRIEVARISDGGDVLCLPLVIPKQKGDAVGTADLLLRAKETGGMARGTRRPSESSFAGMVGLVVVGGKIGPAVDGKAGFTAKDVSKLVPFCEAAAVAVRDAFVFRGLERAGERRQALEEALCSLAPLNFAVPGSHASSIPVGMPATTVGRLADLAR